MIHTRRRRGRGSCPGRSGRCATPGIAGDARRVVVWQEIDGRLVVAWVGDPDVRVGGVAVGEPFDPAQQIVAGAAERDAAEERDRAGRRERERAQRRRPQRRERHRQDRQLLVAPRQRPGRSAARLRTPAGPRAPSRARARRTRASASEGRSTNSALVSTSRPRRRAPASLALVRRARCRARRPRSTRRRARARGAGRAAAPPRPGSVASTPPARASSTGRTPIDGAAYRA